MSDEKMELKKCPFCGGKINKSCLAQGSVGKVYYVICKSCKAEGPVSMYGDDAAIKAWNTRAVEGR